MGSTRPEREDSRARMAYLAAARRFVDAMSGFLATGVPFAPKGPRRELVPWTRTDVATLMELRAALDAVINARRAYDSGRRHR